MGEETLLTKTISHIRKCVLVTISLFVIYHSVLHLESKRDSCQWLLQHGKLVADYKWQPFGCLLNYYNKTDSRLCLRRANISSKLPIHLVFIGDSRMLQLYNYILDHHLARLSYVPTKFDYNILNENLNQNLKYEDEELNLLAEFRWQPLPTNEALVDFTELLHPHEIHKKRLDVNFTNETLPPILKFVNRMIVIGHSIWNIHDKDTPSSLLTTYKTNMTRLLTHVKNLKRAENITQILWSMQDPIIEKKASRLTNTSNSQIDKFNRVAVDLVDSLSINGLSVLSSLRAITKSSSQFMEPDGIHSSDPILDHKAQILLNFICNRVYGFDSNCCTDNQAISITQSLMIILASVIVIIYAVHLFNLPCSTCPNTVRWEKVPDYDHFMMSRDEDINTRSINDDEDQLDSSQSGIEPSNISTVHEDLLVNLAKLSIAILFMFLCDRTNFFMKENKYFTMTSFILPITYVFALGFFFTEVKNDESFSSTITVLSRDQTDELKGWMQLIILIYNLSCAENNLRIYMIIRVLLSSYLFLSGFGHFTYFYKTGDVSWTRYCHVVFRLNLLVLCLCLSMGRPYQYYYFIPLVTFWFTVLYLMMKIKPIKNPQKPSTNDYFWLILKMFILIGFITFLYLSEVFFEKVFLLSIWRFLFASGHEETAVKDWWHHWSVDRYSVPSGIIYGLLHWTIIVPYLGFNSYNIAARGGHSRESSQGSQDGLVLSNPLVTFQETFKPRGSFINTLALIGIAFYTIFAATCNDKASCDEIHAYISYVPILCYIVLRNANELIRSRHSMLFAFIGKISLELSVCQYHIWLAAGQKGLLVLVPSNTTLNLVITSIIFITAAHKLSFINKRLTQYATSVPNRINIDSTTRGAR